MIFLGNLTSISGTKCKVDYINYVPFDPTNGLGKTEVELNQIGILVDNIPETTLPKGQQVNNMYVDTSTKKITYDYINTPEIQEQTIQEQISSLGQQLAQEKLSNIQKDSIISGLGQQVADLKLQVIKLQGGTK